MCIVAPNIHFSSHLPFPQNSGVFQHAVIIVVWSVGGLEFVGFICWRSRRKLFFVDRIKAAKRQPQSFSPLPVPVPLLLPKQLAISTFITKTDGARTGI